MGPPRDTQTPPTAPLVTRLTTPHRTEHSRSKSAPRVYIAPQQQISPQPLQPTPRAAPPPAACMPCWHAQPMTATTPRGVATVRAAVPTLVVNTPAAHVGQMQVPVVAVPGAGAGGIGGGLPQHSAPLVHLPVVGADSAGVCEVGEPYDPYTQVLHDIQRKRSWSPVMRMRFTAETPPKPRLRDVSPGHGIVDAVPRRRHVKRSVLGCN